MRGLFCRSESLNPYGNLALEEYLLSSGRPTLYLWQNDNTVVIGRNQNAYTECDMDYVRASGIRVVRRLTGGGAVYHDRGNLNYSLILPRGLHDIARSTAMIVSALNRIGIPAVTSGRNDILLDDKKISGNAYYSNREVGLHHGTLLYRVDPEKMERALSVPAWKKTKHGIRSVRARVTDIASRFPEIDMARIQDALREAFCGEYGVDRLEAVLPDEQRLRMLEDKYASDDWNFGRINEYDVFQEATFPWGTVKVSVSLAGGRIQSAEISSDSLEADLIDRVREMIRRNDRTAAEGHGVVSDILSVYQNLMMKESLNGKEHENATPGCE